MVYKTPGVFVEEISLFPPSVAAVSTAIPAFIGHTERTVDADGNTLANLPIRITSLLEYEERFGAGYAPATYTVSLDPAAGFAIDNVAPQGGTRYFLYDMLRHYFMNGGGPCYIVSVGDYATPIAYGSTTTGLRGGLAALEKVDEPTLLLIPDAVGLTLPDGSLDFAQIGSLQADVLAQCQKLKDRFGLFDIAGGFEAPNHASQPIDMFRNNVGTNALRYGAAYYPWVTSIFVPTFSFGQLVFQDNVTPPNPIADGTIDTISGDASLDALTTQLRSALATEQNVYNKISGVSLTRANASPLSAHFDALRDAVNAATNATEARPAFTALMQFARDLALSLNDLQDDAGIPPEMTVALTRLEGDTQLQNHLTSLIGFEKNAGVMNSISTTRAVGNVETDYTVLDTSPWINGVTVASIAAEGTDYTNGATNSVAETAQAAANSSALRSAFEGIGEAYASIIDIATFLADQAENALFTTHPFFRSVKEQIERTMQLLPVTGAIAGVYAATDRTRGVWKAPANVSLSGVIGPAQKLNDSEQSTLNVHETGKSINAIRAFAGKGSLVWGARTLDGNDNEWRYVNVRRFFNMVEESVKKATEPFVFESNNANTWTRVRAMIENFLRIQWRQGALAGATPAEAFFVKVGLPETMTSLDILEGRMIVEIGMAVVRPAEFIILRISHKMQES